MSTEELIRRRYLGGGRFDPRAVAPPRPAYVPPVAPPSAPVNRGGLPLALDEKQLKVTLTVVAVKLATPK